MQYDEKENFLRVIHWDDPSHVCYPVPSRYVSYTGAWPTDSRPSQECTQWRDIWGVTWTDADGEIFPTGPALESIQQLDRLPRPDPHDKARVAAAREYLPEIDRSMYFLNVNHPYFLYENGFNILGAEEFLTSLLIEPEAAHALLDILLDFELGVARQYIALCPDQICTMDDYGMQDRLTVSPAVWREFFKPRLKRLYDFYRAELGPEVVINHHSCGHIMPILEDLIEIGVNVINPIQSTANDLAQLRRVTSGRLTLSGGIDGQRVLPHGTEDDVRREVELKLDMLWEDGGYLPMAEKLLGVSESNATAMTRAIAEWSALNVEASRIPVS